MILKGERINLISLSINELLEILSNKENFIKADLSDYEISEVQNGAIKIKITKMQRVNKELHDWFTYWVIQNRETKKGMGLIGYKGITFLKEAEVGYGLDEKYRRKGYMGEALKLLSEWAFSQKNCRKITATKVLKDNFGSQKVLEKNGFERISESAEAYDYIKLKKKIFL